jgi:diguanylate cyclase (GGDEF)-like protein
MERISAWLCPTDQHRARAREAGARVRAARSVAAVASAVALVAMVPFQGWWILLLLAVSTVTIGTFEARLRRSKHPELVVVQSMLVILALLAVGVAFSGGEDSPALPWLILPVTLAAARFRPQVLVVAAAITAAVMAGVSVGVDAQAVADDPTRLIAALTLLIGITAIASALAEGELEHRDLAVLDPLTGLLNRSSLESRAVEIEQQARLTGGPVSLVLLDLDRFKQVNDMYGHERGDAVLRDVAYEIRKSLRSFELVYRIGGEEFLVLLPGVELTEATEIAERVRGSVVEGRPGDLDISVSAGVAAGSGGAIRYDELFRAADGALLEAKRRGRDRVEVAGELPPLSLPGARVFDGDPHACALPRASGGSGTCALPRVSGGSGTART